MKKKDMLPFIVFMTTISLIVTYTPDNWWWDDVQMLQEYYDCINNPDLSLTEKKDCEIPLYKRFRSEIVATAFVLAILYWGFGR
jgi:hypothetical protein